MDRINVCRSWEFDTVRPLDQYHQMPQLDRDFPHRCAFPLGSHPYSGVRFAEVASRTCDRTSGDSDKSLCLGLRWTGASIALSYMSAAIFPVIDRGKGCDMQVPPSSVAYRLGGKRSASYDSAGQHMSAHRELRRTGCTGGSECEIVAGLFQAQDGVALSLSSTGDDDFGLPRLSP